MTNESGCVSGCRYETLHKSVESFNLTLSGRTVTVGEAVWRLLLEEVAAPRELRLVEPPSSMERLAMLPEHEQVG